MSITEKPVYVSLGSNMGDSEKILADAILRLSEQDGITLISSSSVYHTEPQEDKDQPWFYNQVVKLDTSLQAHELLNILHQIEAYFGRDRAKENRYGPRTLDLDILLYKNEIIRTESLSVPHDKLQQRAFVLLPLLEIDENIVISGPYNNKISVQDCLKMINYTQIGYKIEQEF